METMMTRTVPAPTTPTPPSSRQQLASALAPLAVDIGIPLGTYYLLRYGAGLNLITALTLSSVVPALRTLAEFVRARKANGMAILMLTVNAAGIAASFLTGNARLMIAKDSLISCVIGGTILLSAWRGTPLMSGGLKAFLMKGSANRAAAWDRLSMCSERFRRLERRYTAIWGATLLVECILRVVGAVTLPVPTMMWLSTVILVVALGVAIMVSGGAAAEPMDRMIKDEADA